jgi:uncharacterized cofD-like protein
MSAENASHQIVTVGGGSGSPVVNEALLRTGLVPGIDAIAAVFDAGGATGRRRLDSLGQEIAYSDAMRILLSLVEPDQLESKSYQSVRKILNHRDKRDRVLGQDFFNHFFSKQGGFAEIQELLTDLGVNFMGRVLPASTESSNIVFQTQSGLLYFGENQLDDQRMSDDLVIDMHLEPHVNAYVPAAEAIARAKVIFLSCGSLHGSVLSCALPDGMKDAFAQSDAQIYYVSNLVSTPNEMPADMTPPAMAERIEYYTGRRPHGFIVPEMSRAAFNSAHPRAAMLYNKEHSEFLGWEPKDLYRYRDDLGFTIVTHNATSVVQSNGRELVRHDPRLLSQAMQQIVAP